jgi:hypothetical protein
VPLLPPRRCPQAEFSIGLLVGHLFKYAIKAKAALPSLLKVARGWQG